MRRIAPLLALLFPAVPLLVGPATAQGDPRETRAVTLDDHFPFAPPGTYEEWMVRKARLRRQVLVAAGLWPMPDKSPLEPRFRGLIERDGYSVENVAIEALPGFLVTGNLYRPDGPIFAGVLCPHGHWADGRFSELPEADVRAQIARGEEAYLPNGRHHLQARCAQLARMGCVVFHYDMIGYADSRQLDHRDSLGSVQDELYSLSHFGLQTWSSIRALDFLEGVRDVDRKRLGVTGASGGGTQTFVLCAIDDRPRVGFPAVMVSTGMQGGCECENASHLRVGTGNVELAALAAPRAYAMTGANDWTRGIETDGLPQLKQLWGLTGDADRVEAWCYPHFEHNYNLVSRLRMYAWFDEHLELGYTQPVVEREIEPIAPADLSFYNDAHPRPAPMNVEELRKRWRAGSERVIRELVPSDGEGLARWREVVGGALDVLVHASLPEPGAVAGRAPSGGGAGEIVLYRTGLTLREHMRVRVVATLPSDWSGVMVVRAAQDVHAPPPIGLPGGVGLLTVETLATVPVDPDRHARFSGYTYGYNPTLLAERVTGLLLAIAYMRDQEDVQSIRLWGDAESSPQVLLAAALAGDTVERVATEGSWDFTSVDSADDERFLPGALRFGGMPAFASLIAPTELRIAGIDELPEYVRAVYAAAERTDAARTVDRADLAAWISSE